MLAVQASTGDWKRGHSAVLNSPIFSVENQVKPQQVQGLRSGFEEVYPSYSLRLKQILLSILYEDPQQPAKHRGKKNN